MQLNQYPMRLIKPDSCRTCVGYSWGCDGYVPASGSGDNGVLIVAEAAGEHEADQGLPLVGKAGYYLFQQLQRVGVEREGFLIHNVLSCRPPDNKLAKMPYEESVIASCSRNLDDTISRHLAKCRDTGRTPVIVTLGRISFKRVMGLGDKNPIFGYDYLCYPLWNEKYRCWVIAADHPSYLMRGNHHLVPLLQFAVTRALEIAKDGLQLENPPYLLDPLPAEFQQWAKGYQRQWERDPDETFLSYDIETPHKQGSDEEELDREDELDYTILRCSFSYRPGDAVSVPWRSEYLWTLQELFSHPGAKVGWNSASYDEPRIKAQMTMRGDLLDGMLAWHVLNSNLPKGLGFVAPFYAQKMGMWKHLSSDQPARYNAIDADVALRCWLGIRKDLKAHNQWNVFERHIIKVNRVFQYMSAQGVKLDRDLRAESEKKLRGLLDEVAAEMQAAIPEGAKQLQVYKKEPKEKDGLVKVDGTTTTKRCIRCGDLGVGAAHFKSIGKKRLKAGESENPCYGSKAEKAEVATQLWARVIPWSLSKAGLERYQGVMGHKAIIDRKKDKVTFDEKAILRLQKAYPKDRLYPVILRFRSIQKLLGTYIGETQEDGKVRGGLPTDRHGIIHTEFSRNPETLRSASRNPNLQNLPR